MKQNPFKQHTFKEQLERKRQAAAQGETVQKPIDEMSEQELDEALAQTEARARKAKEQALEAGREELAESRSNHSRSPIPALNRRSSKRPWK